jgi:periplasmic divalent cation tolerance protein
MEGLPYIVIFITAGSPEEARTVAEALLKQRMAACVSIVPEVHSLFWWEGHLDSGNETLLFIKTKASLLDDIVRVVKEVHSYDVPEIIALPLIGGNQDYLDWIGKEVLQSTGLPLRGANE